MDTKIKKNNPPHEGANFLLVSWVDTVASLGLPEEKDFELFTQVSNQYKASSRHYHNLTHIKNMLRGLHSYPHEVVDMLALELSIWYHDVIYVPLRKDNETRSALFFKEQLADYLPKERTKKIMGYIAATKTHPLTSDRDLQLFLDLDLAILGQIPAHYTEYTQQVRQEFAYVPSFIYKRGRKTVLKAFLSRSRIFQTAYFHERYEEQARENIQHELSYL